ncbi:DUF4855 domain-containing protein [Pedobacter sp. ASV1-7]|uniref:DUF4855 domain-containing protein n=1 Tax=Pedobacter sp. ASV1-7 TaxID=3145237 RepID=UPI0032E8BE16
MKRLIVIIYILSLTTAGWAQKEVKGEYGKTNIADLVLIYQGGTHRPMEWTKEQFLPYIIHEDSKGNKNWLYDGFLFLEFKDGKGRTYAPGYAKLNARKIEWEWLLDRNFEKDKAFYALNQAIKEQISVMKKPGFKHKLVVGIPSPIFNQKDWGEINGKVMDFSKHEDRIEAGKWYIDKFLERYKQQNYAHLQLEGFYWVDEDVNGCAEILEPLGDYMRSKGKRFYWIPYWNAKGFDQWRKFKFDFAWLQPNHFFNNKIPDSRIDQACDLAKKLGMGMEMEFDPHALNASKEQKSGRLKAYIEAFKRNGAFAESPIAYYEGGNGMYLFSKSNDPKDKALMDELAAEIIKRKSKSFMKKISKVSK